MRQLQDLGHTGDLPDRRLHRDDRRPVGPERDPSAAHARADRGQRPHVLRAGQFWCWIANRTEIRYNSEWFDPLGARGMIQLAARYTLARMLERDDFTKRSRAGCRSRVHELLYPLMQGYDSVALRPTSSSAAPTRSSTCWSGAELQKRVWTGAAGAS
jgi:tyrosyl-tRNA synthetase